jgi:hypothetical protein
LQTVEETFVRKQKNKRKNAPSNYPRTPLMEPINSNTLSAPKRSYIFVSMGIFMIFVGYSRIFHC